jgi:hypothetical protein
LKVESRHQIEEFNRVSERQQATIVKIHGLVLTLQREIVVFDTSGSMGTKPSKVSTGCIAIPKDGESSGRVFP